jgi:hypothetical protein
MTMGHSAGTPLRRVVTHHNGSSSAVLSDDKIQLSSGFGSNAVTIWRNDKHPAELVDKDPVSTSPVIYAPGSLIRVVDFPPNSFGHNHRTASLDYGIVIEGQLEMALSDGSKTIVHAGDVVVQQAVSAISQGILCYNITNLLALLDATSVEQLDKQMESCDICTVAIREDGSRDQRH